MTDDWSTVIPPKGKIEETALALLALCRSAQDVRTTNGGTEFRVPPYLADLYNAPARTPRRRTKKEEGDE